MKRRILLFLNSMEALPRVEFDFRIYWVILNKFLFLIFTEEAYSLDAVTSSGILKAKQKLGRTFNSLS